MRPILSFSGKSCSLTESAFQRKLSSSIKAQKLGFCRIQYPRHHNNQQKYAPNDFPFSTIYEVAQSQLTLIKTRLGKICQLYKQKVKKEDQIDDSFAVNAILKQIRQLISKQIPEQNLISFDADERIFDIEPTPSDLEQRISDCISKCQVYTKDLQTTNINDIKINNPQKKSRRKSTLEAESMFQDSEIFAENSEIENKPSLLCERQNQKIDFSSQDLSDNLIKGQKLWANKGNPEYLEKASCEYKSFSKIETSVKQSTFHSHQRACQQQQQIQQIISKLNALNNELGTLNKGYKMSNSSANTQSTSIKHQSPSIVSAIEEVFLLIKRLNVNFGIKSHIFQCLKPCCRYQRVNGQGVRKNVYTQGPQLNLFGKIKQAAKNSVAREKRSSADQNKNIQNSRAFSAHPRKFISTTTSSSIFGDYSVNQRDRTTKDKAVSKFSKKKRSYSIGNPSTEVLKMYQ